MTRTIGMTVWMVPLLALVGCAAEGDPGPPSAPPRVVVIRAQRADAVKTITLPGDLVGFSEATLYAKVSGYLNRISVDKGDTVTKGQELAEIEVPELAQKLKRAAASLEIRRLTRDRLTHVWTTDPRLVAREDVDIAQGEYEQAKAEVEELETLFNYTHIVAPFDGVITGRFVDPGALIQAGGSRGNAPAEGSASAKGSAVPVVSIADINRLRVYVYVPEAEASAIRFGIPATLTLREFPGRPFTGTVARFAKALDLSTRTMLTEVDLDNPAGELYPGMYADVTLELDRHPNAVELPTTAVGNSESGSFVYVVQDNQLSRVPVTVGMTMEGQMEISAGLTGTEQVVEHLTPLLTEGRKVQPVFAVEHARDAST